MREGAVMKGAAAGRRVGSYCSVPVTEKGARS